MITGTSASFTAQTEGVEQVATWRLQMVTLPYSDVSLAVEKLSINASTTSDMPDSTRLQVGYPAMSCTFTLSGLVDVTDESKTAGWLFGPYQVTSPLYQRDVLYAPVTVDIGLNTDNTAGTTTQGTPEYVRKFTGYVDDYTVNDDGTVTFTCIEKMRQILRGAAQLPALLTLPVTAEYLIDYMLRANTADTVSSWPAPLSDCLVAAGMRTATLPDVGTLLADYAPTYAAGLNGSALSGGGLSGHGSATGSLLNLPHLMAAEYTFGPPYALGGGTIGSATNTSQFLVAEFVITGDVAANPVVLAFSNASGPNIPGPDYSGYLALKVNSTGIDVLSTQFATKTWTVTVAPGTHTVGLVMSWSGTSVTLSVILDGTVNNFTGFTASKFAAAVNYASIGWNSAVTPTATIQALQITANTGGAPVLQPGFTTSYPFTPGAVLDPSLNAVLNVINAVDGDTYSVIQQLCDAELAVAGGDESAVFRFYNRDTISSAQPVRTIKSAASLKAIGGAEISAASIVNHCTVEWNGWTPSATAKNIYTATDPIRIPRGKTVILTPTLDAPSRLLGNVSRAALNVVNDGSLATLGFGVRFSTTKGGAATFNANYIVRGVVQTASNQLQITFTNTAKTDAWLVSSADYLDVPAGTPVLQIAGYAWDSATATVDYQYPTSASSSRFGEVVHEISGNPWMQDFDTATLLAQDIVVDQCTPRPNLTGVSIVPDPRLQLVDVVRIQDPDVTGMDEYARIFGWTLDWDLSSFNMTIDARTLAAPGGWIMGVAGRSEIGSTAYVYPST